MVRMLCSAAILLALPVASLPGQEARPRNKFGVSVEAPVIAITGVKLIDGTGGPARDNQTIIIRGNKIAEVGPAAQIKPPAGAHVIDGAGHTVIPGMIGLHDHLFYTAGGGRYVQASYTAPRLYLASGVTTIRTGGASSGYADIFVKNKVDAGEMVGPRVHVTAPYLTGAANQSPTQAMVTSPEAARRFVRYWHEEGATWLKAYTDIRREDLKAAIDEAHRLGMKVTGHLCSVSFQEAVALGIDNLEHGMLTASDFYANKKPDVCPPDSYGVLAKANPADPAGKATIAAMVQKGIPMTSTLPVFEAFMPGRPVTDQRTLDAMAPEVRERYLQDRKMIDQAGDKAGFPVSALKSAMQFERDFVKAGGLLGAGVDPTGNGGALPGFGDQRGFELLREAGFTPEETVQIVSLNGAKILGIEKELGSVEPGKLADLVLLKGDLSADPSIIRQGVTVFKDGVGYDPAKLIASVKGRVGIN
ncbi:MAG TPA: amidohydrolase family protein [Gemmatimonadales bacterium]|nr:amidohydrolase family protein [Gemmatimonadales bacterium]